MGNGAIMVTVAMGNTKGPPLHIPQESPVVSIGVGIGIYL